MAQVFHVNEHLSLGFNQYITQEALVQSDLRLYQWTSAGNTMQRSLLHRRHSTSLHATILVGYAIKRNCLQCMQHLLVDVVYLQLSNIPICCINGFKWYIFCKISDSRNERKPPPHHNHFMALFQGPPGWAGARREHLDFMVQVQGEINRGRHIDHPAGANPSGLNSAHLDHPPIFYGSDALPAAQPTVSKHWRQLAHSD